MAVGRLRQERDGRVPARGVGRHERGARRVRQGRVRRGGIDEDEGAHEPLPTAAAQIDAAAIPRLPRQQQPIGPPLGQRGQRAQGAVVDAEDGPGIGGAGVLHDVPPERVFGVGGTGERPLSRR